MDGWMDGRSENSVKIKKGKSFHTFEIFFNKKREGRGEISIIRFQKNKNESMVPVQYQEVCQHVQRQSYLELHIYSILLNKSLCNRVFYQNHSF